MKTIDCALRGAALGALISLGSAPTLAQQVTGTPGLSE